MGKQQRHILFVDAFDSFSNNIIGLLERTLDVHVTTVRINNHGACTQLKTVLGAFDAVVVGPGPGHPSIPEDIGLITQLWELEDKHLLPIFAVCLGFQSLGQAYGATVVKLRQPRHGIVTEVAHNNSDIFTDTGSFSATNYHSLKLDLNEASRQNLVPLAWDLLDEINGPVLMAVRHKSKPFWGVQFHPESICTTKDAAEKLISNWWRNAEIWLASRQRTIQRDRCSAVNILSLSLPLPNGNRTKDTLRGATYILDEIRTIMDDRTPRLHWTKRSFSNISPSQLSEFLSGPGETILLDSQGSASGRFSILGIVDPRHTMKLTYKVSERLLRFGIGSETCEYATWKVESIDLVWPLLRAVLGHYKLEDEPRPNGSPFWGGFMGYFSYEAGLDTLEIPLQKSTSAGQVPDINLRFVHQTIVIDQKLSCVYVQSLLPDGEAWVEDMGNEIELLCREKEATVNGMNAALEEALKNSDIMEPQAAAYCAKVTECQDSLRVGDSYELCLTDETQISIPAELDPWELYKQLRQKNPAPFGAYLHLDEVTIVGSSPERFLHWDRQKHVEFRPIKGTVKKSASMSRERAHAILNSSKERAENLMIVDLIRHDLSGVVGAHNCWVSQLMVVEEYETVYQLVSAIEGLLPPDKHGIDILQASLPPGSMTGAPKRRSCEILRDLEKRPRGVYSGVLGYIDIGGGADFSVVIRTAVRGNRDGVWRVGAGGAVTIQSDAKGEYDEMKVKSSSVLGAMRPARNGV